MNKIKSIFYKTALALAFSGAVGGAAYYYFEGKEDKKSDPVEAVIPPVFEEDTVTTVFCASNDNLREVEQNTPQIFRDLSLMEKLPLTGKYIYGILKNPANGIMTCLVPVPEGEPLNSHYSPLIKNANVARGAGSLSTFHEYFHAAQDFNDGGVDMSILTMKDAVFANLLMEASAVAYELAARQEAANHGVRLFGTKKIIKVIAGDTLTLSTMYASDRPEIRAVFRGAYIAAWKKNASLDAQTCEAKSLEAGGKAVVRYLLEGKDAVWMAAYTQQVISNIFKDYDSFQDDGRELKPGYRNRRGDFYSREGVVSSQINFIPDEYLGAAAEQYIDKSFSGVVFGLFNPAPQRVAQKHKPLSPG